MSAPVSVKRAVERDLAEVRKLSKPAASSGLAVAALALARALDDASTSATALAACAKELRETMRALRAQVEAKPSAAEPVDELRGRRAQRKKAGV